MPPRKKAEPAPEPTVKHTTVKPGETLDAVAARTNTTREALIEANGLRHDLLYQGQRLATGPE